MDPLAFPWAKEWFDIHVSVSRNQSFSVTYLLKFLNSLGGEMFTDKLEHMTHYVYLIKIDYVDNHQTLLKIGFTWSLPIRMKQIKREKKADSIEVLSYLKIRGFYNSRTKERNLLNELKHLRLGASEYFNYNPLTIVHFQKNKKCLFDGGVY